MSSCIILSIEGKPDLPVDLIETAIDNHIPVTVMTKLSQMNPLIVVQSVRRCTIYINQEEIDLYTNNYEVALFDKIDIHMAYQLKWKGVATGMGRASDSMTTRISAFCYDATPAQKEQPKQPEQTIAQKILLRGRY